MFEFVSKFQEMNDEIDKVFNELKYISEVTGTGGDSINSIINNLVI